MRKILGYVRVSSEMQKKKNNSIPLQKKKINEYCKLNDFDLIDIYEDDGISGMYIDKRDGYKKMIDYMSKNKIDGIVVWSLSRLGRRMKDVVEFMEFLKKNSISFYSIRESK
jgi:site-specific DNA recombinase